MQYDIIVRAIQKKLKKLGYYHGYLDGKHGPLTATAIIDFKSHNGLVPRDYVGEVTLKTLFCGSPNPAPKVVGSGPPWLDEARRLLGTREVLGTANNPNIMDWAKDLNQWYPGDSVPWCGLFVAHCMSVGAPKEPQDFDRLGARNWLEYGVKASSVKSAPYLGSICVLWRTHPTYSWHGHVFIVTGYNDTHVRGIGGNQSDSVSESWFPRSRVLGYRKPTGAKLKRAVRAKTGAVSTNEA